MRNQLKVIVKSEVENKFNRILFLILCKSITEVGFLVNAYDLLSFRTFVTLNNLWLIPKFKLTLRKKDLKFYKDYLFKDIDSIHSKIIDLLSKCENKSLKAEYSLILKNYSFSYIRIFNQYNKLLAKISEYIFSIIDVFVSTILDNSSITLTKKEKALTIILIICLNIWVLLLSLEKMRSKINISIEQEILDTLFSEIIENSKLINEYQTTQFHVKSVRKAFNNILNKLYNDNWWGYSGINTYNTLNQGGYGILLVLYSYFVPHNSAVQIRLSEGITSAIKAVSEEFISLIDISNEDSISEKLLKYQIQDDTNCIELNKSINLFSIKDLNLTYNNKEIYKNQSFIIKRNSWTNIKGESGSGKTTLINCLLNKNKNYTGNIKFLDKHENYSYENISNLISIYDDNYDLFSSQSILFNVTYGLKKITEETIKDLKHYLRLFKLSSLENRLDENIEKCSLGQKQRVSIIRTIMHDRSIWILDEATSNLDSYVQDIVMNELKRIQINKKKTVIFITHNEKLHKYANKILTIKDGNVNIDYV